MKFPFDPSLKNHIFIALGLALWIFVFLYFTEPLDVSEFGDREKLIYLPIYGLVGALAYTISLPLQQFLYLKKSSWSLKNELIWMLFFSTIAFFIARGCYLYIIVPEEQNPYSLGYYLKSIFFPVLLTILPMVVIGRWSFGKYRHKQLESRKITIHGEGNYEGIRLHFNEIICIRSSDNYIAVTYASAAEPKTQLIRNKLSSIETSFEQLLRTHRSFLINTYHFQSWKIEKGKHSMILSHEIEVPISKTNLAQVKERIQLATK